MHNVAAGMLSTPNIVSMYACTYIGIIHLIDVYTFTIHERQSLNYTNEIVHIIIL